MICDVNILEDDNLFIEGCRLALEAINEYQPISIIDEYMTEAFGKKNKPNTENSGDQAQNSNNAETKDKPTSNTSNEKNNQNGVIQKGKTGLSKMFQAIRNFIRKMKDTINDFLQRRKMDDAERKAMEEFEAAVRQEPSLKNARITVMDFKKTQEEYQKMMGEFDRQIRAARENEKTPIQNMLDKAKNFVTGNAKGFIHTVNAVGIINMAGVDKNIAKFIKSVIDNDEKMLAEMEKAMGAKQFDEFQKDLTKLTKPAMLLRAKLRVSHRLYSDVISAYAGAYKSVGEMASNTLKGKNPFNLKDGNQLAILNGLRQNEHTGQTWNGIKAVGKAVGGAAIMGTKDKAGYIIRKAVSGDPDMVSVDKVQKNKNPLTLKPSFEPVGGNKYKMSADERRAEKATAKEAKRIRRAENKKRRDEYLKARRDAKQQAKQAKA